MATPRIRNSRNEWIHGGKYVKPSASLLSQNVDRQCNEDDHHDNGASRNERTHDDPSPGWRLVTRAQQLIRWMYPVLEMSIRTLIAFFVTLICTMVVAVAMLLRRKREHVTSASMDRPAPEGAALPETTPRPAERGLTPPSLPMASNLSDQRRAGAATLVCPPPKSGPPASAMRSRKVATTTPRSARRVLFSETEQGEVSTTKIHYDKDLPASARKVKNNYAHIVIDRDMSVLTVETNFGHLSSAADAESTMFSSPVISGDAAFSPINNKSIPKAEDLPYRNSANRTTQYSLSIRNENKTTDDSHFSVTAKHAPIDNPKRKRRELIEATSRWNRNHRARVVPNHVFHSHRPSSNLLGKTSALKRRREQEEIDQWIWRAMNDATLKENLNRVGGKKAKGSPVEAAESTVRSVMTPWKGGR